MIFSRLNRTRYAEAVIDLQPIGFWRLNDALGTEARDSAAGEHHGTYLSSPTLGELGPLAEPNSLAVRFDGTSDSVDIPNSFEIPAETPFSAVWFNRVDQSEIQRTFGFFFGRQRNPNRCLAHTPWSDRFLYFDYGNYLANGRVRADYTPHIGKWTHVACVSAGSGGGFKGIYFDGEIAVSDTSSDSPSVNLRGGAISSRSVTDLPQYFRGRMADFAVFNVALSADEIRHLYLSAQNGVF